MKIRNLFEFSPLIDLPEAAPHLDLEVRHLQIDSREVSPGDVFIAVKGLHSDGHNFLEDAIRRGCIAIVVNEKTVIPSDYKGFVFRAEQTEKALELLMEVFYRNPSFHLKMIGVTGTNGKTSITAMVEHILNENKIPCGVIGTINHHFQNHIWDTQLTTPDQLTLRKRLGEFLAKGALATAMEVSSHALDQGRVDGVYFDVAIFTNLTRDHLDYHKTMENYFQAKQILFRDSLASPMKPRTRAVINIDDPYGRSLECAERSQVWTYGSSRDADFFYHLVQFTRTDSRFMIESPFGHIQTRWKLLGHHNIMNGLASCIAVSCLGLPFETCVRSMETFHNVPGRLESVVARNEAVAFIDYAHSPDALTKALSTLRAVVESQKSGPPIRIITVFGCGGDRDKGKRPLMMKAALELSDTIVVTSDNPRTEDPTAIIDEILKGREDNHGRSQVEVYVEVDREKAIKAAIAMSKPQDLILIAGKGHENYQIFGTEKRHFSDREVVESYSWESK